jgi:hypothetical protein
VPNGVRVRDILETAADVSRCDRLYVPHDDYFYRASEDFCLCVQVDTVKILATTGKNFESHCMDETKYDMYVRKQLRLPTDMSSEEYWEGVSDSECDSDLRDDI